MFFIFERINCQVQPDSAVDANPFLSAFGYHKEPEGYKAIVKIYSKQTSELWQAPGIFSIILIGKLCFYKARNDSFLFQNLSPGSKKSPDLPSWTRSFRTK